MKLNIDKSNWTPVSFGDVVAERRKTTKDPVAEGLAHIVGLEHIDTGSIHLRRSEPITSDTTFSKTFKKGDVLFGRRRAYLKKAAQAPFAGICSGDITVMYAKDDLMPELLPFLVNNDKFFDYAVEHSAGGLSPRVKFRDLANYQFLLPPKAEQARLAELLWAGDGVLEGLERAMLKNIELKHSYRKEILLGSDYNSVRIVSRNFKNIRSAKIKEVCRIDNGPRKPINKNDRDSMKGPYPYYGPTGILSKINEFKYEGEYVVVGEDGDHFLKFNDWSMSQLVSGRFNVNNHAHVLTGTSKCRTKWLYYVMQHKNIFTNLTKQGSTRYKLTKESLGQIEIVLPEIDRQDQLINSLDQFEISIGCQQSAIKSTRTLQKSLINQIF